MRHDSPPESLFANVLEMSRGLTWPGMLYYPYSMKTSISIPDDVFALAEALARKQAVSMSELYAAAVAEYVARHRHQDVTARLNRVYSELPSEVDPALRRMQARSIQGEW